MEGAGRLRVGENGRRATSKRLEQRPMVGEIHHHNMRMLIASDQYRLFMLLLRDPGVPSG
jgi:hypothetical protein